MKPILDATAMREAEQPLLDAGEDLMSRAAAAVAAEARFMVERSERLGPIVVAVGPGNNGGDALFAAALLADELDVALWLTHDRAHEAGLAKARAAGCREVDAATATSLTVDAALVIDGVFGIGGRPGLEGQVAVFAASCRDVSTPVLSVDIPSGLDSDSGRAFPSFHATRTVTFAGLKYCHAVAPAAELCGVVTVADIGVAVPDPKVQQVEPEDMIRWWPLPDYSSDKYSRGVVGIDAGSAHYPGAAILSCAGALHAGAGMVRYLGDAEPTLVLGRFPSVVVAPGRVQAQVVGSGWGPRDDAHARLSEACQLGVPLVVDADAIQLAPEVDLPPNSLVTPHAGELARLLGVSRDEVSANPLDHTRRAASSLGATVLLKGATQYVASSGVSAIAYRGPAWSAQAGSGDVLAGVCGTLLASGLSAIRAGALAASLQAMTAQRHPGPFPPDSMAERFASVVSEFADIRG